jgi:hypothetical protein
VCFDNFEAKGLGCREEAAQNILQQVADYLSQFHHLITIGTGLGDIDLAPWQENAHPTLDIPNNYSGYTDAHNQRVLRQSDSCVPVVRKPQDTWVRGATQDDLEDSSLQSIADVCYPEGWRFVSTDDTDMGFVLMNKTHGAIGYCAIETSQKYIADIAVHPEHRQHSMVLVRHVLRVIKSLGGEWTCDARESTSFKLLKLLDRRGIVHIISHHHDGGMNGEPMYKVVFEVVI